MDQLTVLTEFSQFMLLPKDLMRKFMEEYFDPISSLNCLRVCKLLKEIANTRLIQIRVVKLISYENQMIIVNDKTKFANFRNNQTIPCTLCDGHIYRKSMAAHLLKHKQGRITNILQPSRIPKPEFCTLCDAPYPDIGPHYVLGCPLELYVCQKYALVEYRKWLDLLCSKPQGCRKEMRKHECKFKCRKCQDVFSFDGSECRDSVLDRHWIRCYSGKE